jgi:hypothetical protein
MNKMTATEKWNKIVEQYNKHINAAEDIVQSVWEKIFAEIFGYSSLAGEIESQRIIRIGSTERVITDIIIKDDSTDLFVVELKKHNLPLNTGIEMQLLSYLKQLRNSTGILICDKIYVYAYDYSKNDNEQDKVEIDFKQNNPDGIEVVEMFSKAMFDEQAVKEFVYHKIEYIKNVERIKNELTSELTISLLKNYFTEKYGTIEFEQAIAGLNITIAPRITTLNISSLSNLSQAPSNHNEKHRIRRSEAHRICSDNGIKYDINDSNYANRFIGRDTYNIDPPIKRLTENWWLLLADPINKELHVFNIQVNAMPKEQIKFRENGPQTFLLRIRCDDKTFEDVNSRIKFQQWLVKTIKF